MLRRAPTSLCGLPTAAAAHRSRSVVGAPAVSHPALLAASRPISGAADPSTLLTSPGGLVALLYGRSALPSAASCGDAEKVCDGRGGRRRGRQRVARRRAATGAVGHGDGSEGGGGGRSSFRTFTESVMGSEALLLAAVIFGLSAIWELCKSQKSVVTEKVKNFFLSTLEVRSSQTEYAMIIDWMARQDNGKSSRNLALKPVTVVDESDACDSRIKTSDGRSDLVPGYGVHLFSYKGTKLWVTRTQDESKTRGTHSTQLDREHDVLTITFFTRDRRVVESFLADVCESWAENVSERVQIMAYDYGRWQVLTERTRRPLRTIFLPPEAKNTVEEIRSFFGLRHTYAQLGIPWRRGYLFHGPPGTGKSSLVLAMAGELHVPVCVLSLMSRNLDDQTLLTQISTLPPRCILLLEDFENAIEQVHTQSAVISANSSGRVSLSGLLNALDGVSSSEGRVVIMTSNDVSRIPLPDALLRPGRIDRRVRFAPLRDEEFSEMRDTFVRTMQESGEPTLAAAAAAAGRKAAQADSKVSGLTPAAFQQSLLNVIYEAMDTTDCTNRL